jgi:hypothetical protein
MQCDPAAIAAMSIETRAVTTPGSLMHHKYIVRDLRSLWTGSTNWTDDAFGREENVLITIDAPPIAAAYTRNFERLWDKRHTRRSGGTGEEVVLRRGTRVQPFFSPWPPHLSQLAASRIADADRRVRVVSPVVTSGAVLGTLAERAGREGSTSTARSIAHRFSKCNENGRGSPTIDGRSRRGGPSRRVSRGRFRRRTHRMRCTTICTRSSSLPTNTWCPAATNCRNMGRSMPRTSFTS